MSETYTQNDMIIKRALERQAEDRTLVTIEITDDLVTLKVGPRDWDWDRKTGKLIGCGTKICDPFSPGGLPDEIPEDKLQ